jgi:hypothetical protein
MNDRTLRAVRRRPPPVALAVPDGPAWPMDEDSVLMKNLLMVMLVSVVLAGCSTSSADPTPTLPPVPADAASTAVPQITPQLPGMGNVEGIVIDEADLPIEGLGIYVAKISVDNMISYSPEADPRGLTDAAGRFTISNVQPGTYALAYWTPGPTGLFMSPANPDNAITIEVRADETTQVGNLKIKRP